MKMPINLWLVTTVKVGRQFDAVGLVTGGLVIG